MAAKSLDLPLIVIVGPTASGKTALSIELAKACGGEIISADSRAIYKGMNIGTAKPTRAEQSVVPHWGIDLVEPGVYFSVADFKDYANRRISEIRARGHVPFLVGGTGLYIDAVIFDYKFGSSADNDLRSKLQHMNIDELQAYCADNGVMLPENNMNRRYLIRAIENKGVVNGRTAEPQKNCIVVGITTDKELLKTRIERRVEQIFKDGVVDEAKILGDNYGWASEAMKSNIYPVVRRHLDGQMSLEQMKEKLTTLDWRLAKRQMTWFRRNKFIQWLSLDDAKVYLKERLANYIQP